tara:strand:+ start:4626 stop:5456 length:831 start_codon:yes stop_codon:yes gene_type:complete
MNDSFLDSHMRKALAQNPNLLRTLIGLGLTLILLLAYAVYGATINTEIYVYESNSNETVVSLDDAERYYSPDDNTTTWTWDADLNGVNLTWVNLTVVSLSSGSIIAISNGEGLYSHPDLGNPDADEFSCTESCKKRIEHRTNSTGETTSIISLTNPDPAIRGKGSVYADSQEEASKKATKILNSTFEPTKVRITIIEEGNRTVNPSVELTQVNESLYNVEMFEVDAATEFLWALAAVIGCFSMVLVPSFTVYFAARAKQKKTELKLESARINIEEE